MAEEMKDKDQTLENGQEARETTEETGTASQTEETPEEKDGGVGEEPQTEKKGFFGKKKDKKDKKDIQIEELTDKLKRQMAEFDNYRKRTIKEKSELILNGGQKVLESLLPVLDDLERAQTNMDKSDDVATLKEGVELIIDKLTKTLSTQGLSKIETDGSAFDTDFHEAIALVPVEDESKKNQIIDCVQTGYTLNGKVIRHAKVAVGQ